MISKFYVVALGLISSFVYAGNPTSFPDTVGLKAVQLIEAVHQVQTSALKGELDSTCYRLANLERQLQELLSAANGEKVCSSAKSVVLLLAERSELVQGFCGISPTSIERGNVKALESELLLTVTRLDDFLGSCSKISK